MTVVNRMGAWVAECSRQWPAAALATARIAFVDTIGVMIPGANEAAAKKIVSVVSAYGDGPSSIFLCDQKTSAPYC